MSNVNTQMQLFLLCSILSCSRPPVARGWCLLHYKRWRKTGDPLQVRQAQRIKHGHFLNGKKSLEYSSWSSMLTRCTNSKATRWDYYGGRGITVCDRWRDFELFLADMGPRPGKAYSIERRDNEQGYEQTNCYWATRSQQMANRRKLSKPTSTKGP